MFLRSDTVILFLLFLIIVASIGDEAVIQKVGDYFLSKHLIIV